MGKYDEERQWRTEAKEKLVKRASKATTNKQFNQIMTVVAQHNEELSKIDKITKDFRNWR